MLPLQTIALIAVLQQPIDATALTITLDKGNFTVRVGRWELKTIKVKEMNRFVDLHIKEIDPDKIVIYGDPNATYPEFQAIISVMKKHDWLKFKLEKTGPKPKPATPKVETTSGYLIELPV